MGNLKQIFIKHNEKIYNRYKGCVAMVGGCIGIVVGYTDNPARPLIIGVTNDKFGHTKFRLKEKNTKVFLQGRRSNYIKLISGFKTNIINRKKRGY